MKKNRYMRLAGLMLILAMATTVVLGGTLARYYATAGGSASAQVAKFSVKIGDDDIADADANYSLEVALFDTILDSNRIYNETDVDEGTDGTNYIAPGTSGQFVLDITNESQVTVNAKFSVTTTNTGGIPILFSTNNQDWSSSLSIDDQNGVELESIGAANERGSDEYRKTTQNIFWQWVFEDNDVGIDDLDTQLGKAARTNPDKVTATVTVEVVQVD